MTKGERIKQVLIAKKIKQKDVAKTLGITPQYLRLIMKDKAKNVSQRIYDSFCLRYGVDPGFFENEKPVAVPKPDEGWEQELISVCRALQNDARQEVLGLARFLLENYSGGKRGQSIEKQPKQPKMG